LQQTGFIPFDNLCSVPAVVFAEAGRTKRLQLEVISKSPVWS
jgi:hypothetical protein